MIRKAQCIDISQIQKLINDYARSGYMLPRSLNELYETIRDFTVYEDNHKIIGCCALHISWEDLGEIRSLAVEKQSQGKGIGRSLILACIEEAKGLKLKRVFVLTEIIDFFKKFGFKNIDKSELPHKIWGDCLACIRFPDCNEVALAIVL
ncbi:MAG: N-acetyltransferase [Candidatus Omnitrophota bacterium]